VPERRAFFRKLIRYKFAAGPNKSPPFDVLRDERIIVRRLSLLLQPRIVTNKEHAMAVQSPAELVKKKCAPCEGGVEPYSPDEAKSQLIQLDGWRLSHDGQRIRKDWKVKNFMAGMDFFNRCAELAEDDGHHPDLHIEGYRNVWVELWTHAIGGLSENDFILAAKIDQLPIQRKE
jgi:4a-hydroxytetrahydrobiopterin dehydratase